MSYEMLEETQEDTTQYIFWFKFYLQHKTLVNYLKSKQCDYLPTTTIISGHDVTKVYL